MEIIAFGIVVAIAAVFAWLYWREGRKNRALDRENIQLKASAETGQQQHQLFENIANRVLDAQNKKNREEIDKTLQPLRHNLEDFRARVENINRDNASGRAALKQQIEALQNTSLQLAEDAENLTKALKSDKKMQGDWGEMILERVLEHSGLEKDREYRLQPSFKNDEGERRYPDAVVYLPDDKQIVIDAKVSLNAYVDYCNATEEGGNQDLLQQHIQAVRKHINELAAKDYARLPELNSIEYILLFFSVEPALILAQTEDSSLFEQALKQRIILVAPSTLLATLKVIHNIWRNEKRNKNAEEIARQAGAMYDKLHGFVTDLDDVRNSLDKATYSVDAARNKLSQGRGNLIGRAQKIQELGADTKKQLPDAAEE